MDFEICFFVAGIPKPAGSKRVFMNRKTGKPIVTDMSGKAGSDWRADVKFAAAQEFAGEPLIGALAVSFVFYLPRPKSHFYTGARSGVLREKAPKYPTVKPDATKLLRGVEDALTSIVWKDDAQIVAQQSRKKYCDADHPQPGVRIRVQVWE